jgi:hypothetical protein
MFQEHHMLEKRRSNQNRMYQAYFKILNKHIPLDFKQPSLTFV